MNAGAPTPGGLDTTAERPVFLPRREGRLVEIVPVRFDWRSGGAPARERNARELHAVAARQGISHLLEVSGRSERLIGRRLSAFTRKLTLAAGTFPLECVYQGSKVFEYGGPYLDLLCVSPDRAKRDPRLRQSGELTAFEVEGRRFPLLPRTAFYDWLYIHSMMPERRRLSRLAVLNGFTDVEFDPVRSVNCQARSCAVFVALETRRKLDQAMSSFDAFLEATGTRD